MGGATAGGIGFGASGLAASGLVASGFNGAGLGNSPFPSFTLAGTALGFSVLSSAFGGEGCGGRSTALPICESVLEGEGILVGTGGAAVLTTDLSVLERATSKAAIRAAA